MPPSTASLCAAPRVRWTQPAPPPHTLKFQPEGSECTSSPLLPHLGPYSLLHLLIHMLPRMALSPEVTGCVRPYPAPANLLPAPHPCPWLATLHSHKLNHLPFCDPSGDHCTPTSHCMSPSSTDFCHPTSVSVNSSSVLTAVHWLLSSYMPASHGPLSSSVPAITGPFHPMSLSCIHFFQPYPISLVPTTPHPHLHGPSRCVSLSITAVIPRPCLCRHPTSLSLFDPCPPTLTSLLGVERILMLPGSQTAFDLDDVQAGLSYTVRVSARVGPREGSASVLTVRRGEHYRKLVEDSCLPHSGPGSDL